MAEGEVVPIHYVGHKYQSQADITDMLASNDNNVRRDAYLGARDIYDDRHTRQLGEESSRIRSAMTRALEEELEEYKGFLGEKKGEGYEDHLSSTLHHLERDDKKDWSRRIARKLTRAAMGAVYKQEQVEEYMKDDTLVNNFIAAHMPQQAQISSIEDFAKLIAEEEKYSLHEIISGANPEVHQDSALAQITGAYTKELTSVQRNRTAYSKALGEHIRDTDRYEEFVNLLNDEGLARHGAYADLTLDRGTAVRYWQSAGRKAFALPEADVPGLTKPPAAANDNEPPQRLDRAA